MWKNCFTSYVCKRLLSRGMFGVFDLQIMVNLELCMGKNCTLRKLEKLCLPNWHRVCFWHSIGYIAVLRNVSVLFQCRLSYYSALAKNVRYHSDKNYWTLLCVVNAYYDVLFSFVFRAMFLLYLRTTLPALKSMDNELNLVSGTPQVRKWSVVTFK